MYTKQDFASGRLLFSAYNINKKEYISITRIRYLGMCL